MCVLTRDRFREGVLDRDCHVCVVPGCGRDAVDAHHLIERSLWPDEGYYLDNGASVCERCHKLAEKDILTPDSLRTWAGISERKMPPDTGKLVTKWGIDVKTPDSYMTARYPSTPYLDFSTGMKGRDVIFGDYELWVGSKIVVTAKMDGSCAKLTRGYVAARNGEYAKLREFDWLKSLWSGFCMQIPEDVMIFGEWCAYKHTISYSGGIALKSPLLIYGAFDGTHWVGWDSVEHLAGLIGYPTVPVIGSAEADKGWSLRELIKHHAEKAIDQGHEGVVARIATPFYWGQFEHRIAKFVRESFDPGKDMGKMIKNEII